MKYIHQAISDEAKYENERQYGHDIARLTALATTANVRSIAFCTCLTPFLFREVSRARTR